jgi:hypothetical protein
MPPPINPGEPLDKPAEEPAPLPMAGGFGGLQNIPVGHAFLRADYRMTWFAEESVAGQRTDLSSFRHDFGFSTPIFQGPKDEWTAFVNARGEIFRTSAILLDTQQPFPRELWSVRAGTGYRYLFDNGWITGGTVSVGSASDKPFHSIDEMTAGVNAFLRIPSGEHNAWLFSLSYSTNAELPVPLPGIAYIWQPSDTLRMNIGLPFQVLYRPIDDLTFDFSYMLLRTVHARATYRITRMIRAYAGFDWRNESYFLADRPAVNDRFYYYDKEVNMGLLFLLGKHASLDFTAGYTFDRFYFEGANYNDRNFDRIDVGDGPYVAVRLDVRF